MGKHDDLMVCMSLAQTEAETNFVTGRLYGETFKSMKPIIRIDIASDVVCPWCYIGKRRLEKAIDLVKDKFNFEVVYHPFELNPGMPKEGKNQKEYLADKFGGDERYDHLTNNVTSVAATEGIEFNFPKQNVSPNTRDMHRIIQLVSGSAIQAALVEAFFKAYFTEGVDLSKHANLVDIAVKAGVDKTRVEKLLQSDDLTAEVITSENQMQKLGISGVPFYIINNKYGVSGAQASKTFADAFNQLGLEMQTVSGDTCSVDDPNC
jgi:predicted DsbA family dithiol-disulfide isomerase